MDKENIIIKIKSLEREKKFYKSQGYQRDFIECFFGILIEELEDKLRGKNE